MTELARKALLPAGLQDVLPGTAAREADIREKLMSSFAHAGYDRVKTPLVEFEESLLEGAAPELATQTFRLMDPVSHRMMGVRSDMTPQVGRIAATRLGDAPRPLRLSYSGDVLRIKGTQLRPERQFAQVGAELIGVSSAAADTEIVLLALEALEHVGLPDVSVDLNLPTLPVRLFDAFGVAPDDRETLIAALEHRDVAAVKAVSGNVTDVLVALLEAAGPAQAALPKLRKLELPLGASEELHRLIEVAERILASDLDAALTIDPVEMAGFRYQTGVSFTLFAKHVRGELGRGGRYRAGGSGGEAATGMSLFMDTILRGLADVKPVERVYLPLGTPQREARKLRKDGHYTVAALEGAAEAKTEDAARKEARRMGCSFIYLGGQIVPLGV
ncbi:MULTISPECIES: ATP phosphoribosyltransferase regulatory subunit [Thalassospira]|jgi:ATP phosphoribosyltransferase regulatory subunit|uniref:ATP phosphoribosyltransferase regulatory subunit n=1 Tax=Thalassospira TaxID=168934 RepID=UPI000C60F64D|nr:MULTISPECIES: ATP phosphoribosyltransferase regulatory subunit [Thalassospira]MAZ35087.1 ATP phosphoribosyltransferase regulatory subunit [Thalassospira sp.]MCH2274437.1 ATP phosphoribosyltransferase regulatory subunit [Thalassospira sp.]WOI10228.1 ATP phosphoribosyltransferase regulatory subunit [Thalassospira lucentensis]